MHISEDCTPRRNIFITFAVSFGIQFRVNSNSSIYGIVMHSKQPLKEICE